MVYSSPQIERPILFQYNFFGRDLHGSGLLFFYLFAGFWGLYDTYIHATNPLTSSRIAMPIPSTPAAGVGVDRRHGLQRRLRDASADGAPRLQRWVGTHR